MGGKGKKGISQIAKRQEKEMKKAQQQKKPHTVEKKEQKTKVTLTAAETTILDNIRNEIKTMPYVSSWSISSKYGITMGEAKRLLQILEKEGLIKYAYKHSRNPIFTAA
jgi:ribosomal protein S25